MPTEVIQRIAYEFTPGEGAGTVLCIHGLGGSSNTWTPVMDALRRYNVLRIDLPSSGRSAQADTEQRLSIERMAKACSRVLAAKNIDKVHLVGHSMGCIVSMALAAFNPKLVQSLALFGPLFAPPDPARTAIRARAEKARQEGVSGMAAIADALVQASTSAQTKRERHAAVAFVRESLMRQDPQAYARSCDALADTVATDPDRIKCPTLLVTGDEDVVAPPQAVRIMNSKIAGSELHVLRGCGHWTPLEMPNECMAAMKQFHARLRV
jgi:3-oxoadipate enol-lactonase